MLSVEFFKCISGIPTANVANTLRLTQKRSRLINGSIGKRKNIYFDVGVSCHFKWKRSSVNVISALTPVLSLL